MLYDETCSQSWCECHVERIAMEQGPVTELEGHEQLAQQPQQPAAQRARQPLMVCLHVVTARRNRAVWHQ